MEENGLGKGQQAPPRPLYSARASVHMFAQQVHTSVMGSESCFVIWIRHACIPGPAGKSAHVHKLQAMVARVQLLYPRVALWSATLARHHHMSVGLQPGLTHLLTPSCT